MKMSCRILRLVAAAALAGLTALPLFAQPPHFKHEPVARDFGADHFVAGGSVLVTKPVVGDLGAAGGRVEVSGDVGGDAFIAGGNVRVGAAVRQGLYVGGGRVVINGTVQRNARIGGGTVEIAPQAKIAGNLSIGGGEVRVSGAIDGYLQAGGGHVYIDAVIGGDVEVGGGAVELGPNARIGGRMRYASREDLKRDPAAQVQGGVARLTLRAAWPVPSRVQENFGRGVGWVWSVGLALMAALLVVAVPRIQASIGATLRGRWALSLLIGFIALVCIPAAAMIAIFTVVGVPLALGGMALYLALLLLGYVCAGIALGGWALQRLQPARAAQTGWRVAAAVLGMLAISLLGRLPWLGGLVVLAALLLGVGALLLQAPPRRAAATAQVA